MNWDIVIGLLQNVAILLSFALLYDYFWISSTKKKSLTKKFFSGLIIGAITLILMLTPGVLSPGLVFDTRSVILSISGLFFGIIPTAIAVIIASLYRIFLGGDGVYMGTAVIITAGAIGVLYRRFRPNWRESKFLKELLLLGLITHIVMLLCTFLLPDTKMLSTIKAIIVPLIFVYTPGTVLLGWFMVKQEVNRRNHRVNEKLVESERRFTDMLTNVKLLSVILDNDGNITFCNEYFLKLTGHRYHEIAGKDWIDLFVIKEKRAQTRKRIRNHTVYSHFESEIITRDGKILDVFWSNVLLKDEAGYVTGIASIGENITDRKIAEEKLVASKVKAEESDRLKTVFLSNMSHEIRTPLNAIVGFAELMSDPNISNKVKTDYYEIIKNSSDKLIQIINDILDISKLETNQFNISRANCSLFDIMNNTYESHKNSSKFKNNSDVVLVMDFPEHLHKFEFESDSNRIQQVLDNLITNAAKYTKRGQIEFGASTSIANGEQVVEFYVSDTGIGISEDMFDVIFERFRQVEENAYHHGSGIGLSICKGILDLMGGKIWVSSHLGVGSRFSFIIPYFSDTISNRVIKPIEKVVLEVMNKRVIIAEDDNNSFFYLNALLKGHNLDVMHAENGDVLMSLLENETPDLILLDLNMPGKSGYECLSEIKEKGIKTRIIAQTAYAGHDERDRCIERGCDDYISKPIKRNELYSVINKVMSDI